MKISEDLAYYENNKERQQKKACERYQSLPRDKKEKKQQHDHEQH